jgi:hypothetical protein
MRIARATASKTSVSARGPHKIPNARVSVRSDRASALDHVRKVRDKQHISREADVLHPIPLHLAIPKESVTKLDVAHPMGPLRLALIPHSKKSRRIKKPLEHEPVEVSELETSSPQVSSPIGHIADDRFAKDRVSKVCRIESNVSPTVG